MNYLYNLLNQARTFKEKTWNNWKIQWDRFVATPFMLFAVKITHFPQNTKITSTANKKGSLKGKWEGRKELSKTVKRPRKHCSMPS